MVWVADRRASRRRRGRLSHQAMTGAPSQSARIGRAAASAVAAGRRQARQPPRPTGTGRPTSRGNWRRDRLPVAARPVPRTGSTRAVGGASTSMRHSVRSDCAQADDRLVREAGNPDCGLRQSATGRAARPRTHAGRRPSSRGLRNNASRPFSKRRDGDEPGEGERPGPWRAARRTSRSAAAARAPSAPGCAAGCRRSSSSDRPESGLDSLRPSAAGTRGISQLTICQSPRIHRSCRRTSLA